MACANWTISILALIIIALAEWPQILGAYASGWVIMIAGVVIIIVVWTGVDCRWCKMAKEAKSRPARRRRRR